MNGYMQCHVCHGKMFPSVMSQTFQRQDPESKVITSKKIDVTGFVCENCGEIVYTSAEAKRIEDIMLGRYTTLA